MFLIVGLGNSEEKYEKTYHNVGFLAADRLASSLLLTPETIQIRLRWRFRRIESIIYKTDSFILAKPQCFMNETGGIVAPLLKHYALSPKDIIVIQDDSDMLLGTFKLKFDGSSGGHRGIESIIHALGTQRFWRLKIGIRTEHEITRLKAEKLVLQHIGKEKMEILEQTLNAALNELRRQFNI